MKKITLVVAGIASVAALTLAGCGKTKKVEHVKGYQDCVVHTGDNKFCLVGKTKADKAKDCKDDAYTAISKIKPGTCDPDQAKHVNVTSQIAKANTALDTANADVTDKTKAVTKAQAAVKNNKDDSKKESLNANVTAAETALTKAKGAQAAAQKTADELNGLPKGGDTKAEDKDSGNKPS